MTTETIRIPRHTVMCGLVLVMVAACSTIPDADKALLAATTDCAQAEARIAELEAIRPTVAQRAVAAAGSIAPAGIVTGIAMRDYRDRVRVAVGSHDDDIDARIAAIRAQCGLPAPPDGSDA